MNLRLDWAKESRLLVLFLNVTCIVRITVFGAPDGRLLLQSTPGDVTLHKLCSVIAPDHLQVV
jgi:hypothetical protein